MSIDNVLITLSWGLTSGYLILRTLDSLLAVAVCLQGLLQRRWKQLANRAAPGQISYVTILRMLLRVSAYLLLFGFLLKFGDRLVQREYQFAYQGMQFILWSVAAMIPIGLRFRSSLRRLIVVWKVTHEFDYAEKRKRTQMLRK